MGLRTLGIVGLLAVLLAIGGCSAFGGAQATPTLTPADVPPAPTATPGVPTLAPGITADGVVAQEYLAERHVAAIANRSYAWNETQREYQRKRKAHIAVESRTSVTTNGTAYYRRTEYVGASPSRAGPYAYRLEEFGVEGTGYTRWLSSREGEPGYGRADDAALAPAHNLSVAESIRTHLALEDAAVARVSIDGRPYVRVTGTLENHTTYGPVENYSVRALVREDGFVRQLAANFTVTVDDERIPVEYRFAYADVGTTEVTAPAWLDEARERVRNDPSESTG